MKDITIKGKILTMDALLTQKEIAKKIIKEGGYYLMVAKDNQSFLKDDIELLIEFDNNVGDTESYTKTEKGHGRVDNKKININKLKRYYRLVWS